MPTEDCLHCDHYATCESQHRLAAAIECGMQWEVLENVQELHDAKYTLLKQHCRKYRKAEEGE